jgi:hypothetical protein
MSDHELTGYASVNASWGCDPREMRKPTDKEAIKACRLLLAEGFRAFGQPAAAKRKRKFELTSGRRRTWPRSGIWYVNPNECNMGFAEIVHSVSHWVHREVNPGFSRLRGGGHQGHVTVEQHLVDFVKAKRWIEDGLKVAQDKPEPTGEEKKAKRILTLQERLKKWETKKKRAETAIKKLGASIKRAGIKTA